jgi:predicted TIM-barrel fold metal-dependent hydrolase
MVTNSRPSRVIAIEEAFLHPSVWEHFPIEWQKKFEVMKAKLTDVGPARIRHMDAAGIDMQVLSHVQPGVQLLEDAALSIRLSTEVNDWLAEIVATYPTRFAGFAMLPTQSPKDAADELERTVTKFGFKGALINGHTNGVYLDDPSFDVLFERAVALDVPIYIHPTDPPQQVTDTYYSPYSEAIVSTWGWPVETGTHLLRLICSGVFDRYPELKIIVGHMGELLPYCFTRLNLGLTMADWLIAVQAKKDGQAHEVASMQKSVGYYMKKNIFITSSGVFDQPVFNCAHAMLGLTNLLFSVDEPFQDSFAGMEFLDGIDLTPEEKEWFAHGCAESLLKLEGTIGVNGSSRRSFGDRVYEAQTRLKSRAGRALISALVK